MGECVCTILKGVLYVRDLGKLVVMDLEDGYKKFWWRRVLRSVRGGDWSVWVGQVFAGVGLDGVVRQKQLLLHLPFSLM